ncbi:uncharacterized protein LOC130745025 [Lotus japonicus]|uniref:uncharacterized protein LOC130745025 n=1 Tax=Lotus japonicus TaxID=34305 RepID=UPI002586660F|nr:uncharacterized protein LOC130745025 [Lotus japonicus]
MWKQEEQYWGQRSRLKWIQFGDKNPKFFHATTVQRRDRNRLERLKDDNGTWREGKSQILEAFHQHYSNIYKSEGTQQIDRCLGSVPRKVTDELNELLIEEVSYEEIVEALNSLGSMKAPGPDGFNGLFFKSHWNSIKDDVCAAIQNFFREGDLPTDINETVVALVPKVPGPENVVQFRPISCCNFLLKMVTRIMVIRLKGALNDLITPNQSAFVGGMMIQDNILVAQEVFHGLKKRGKELKDFLAIKLDLSKAYDRLEWVFLERALLAYGFHEKWVTQVMRVVRGVTYKYKINGHLGKKLIPERGLRQGDPLSPYLFVLAVDVLSHMLIQAQRDGRIEGLQLAPTAPKLTHLFFADDSLLFAKASDQEAYQIVDILNTFSLASGQRINTSKSGIICSLFLHQQQKLSYANILKMEVWDNPGKYLGLPATWGRNKTNCLDWVKERIMGKMEGWKESLLNQAGKEVLIKAVIQAIPTYAMAVVKFPKTFCSYLNAAVARFWWRNHGRDKGIHWKSWNCLSKRKSEGGMGFRDFIFQNTSYLAKQAWRMISNPDALWVSVLKVVYYPSSDFFEAHKGRSSSWIWSSLLEGRDFLARKGRWAVGNGKDINICDDAWLWNGEIIKGTGPQPNLKVNHLIIPNGGGWDRTKVSQLFPPQLAIKIMQTPVGLTGCSDKFLWPHTKSGDYSIKTGYHIARLECINNTAQATSSYIIPEATWKLIWKSNLPQKIKVFLWKSCNNALAVKDNLYRRKIPVDRSCPICLSEPETIEHALLLCPWTRAVWFGAPYPRFINREGLGTFDHWLLQMSQALRGDGPTQEEEWSTLCYTIWAIWKGRNKAVFSSEEPNPVATIQQLKFMLADSSSYRASIPEKLNTRTGNTHNRQRDHSWVHPPQGIIKINVDASIKDPNPSCCLGVVARDHTGILIMGAAMRSFASSPASAEALALREGVILAANLGWNRILVESDCLALVETCKGNMQLAEVRAIMDDVYELRKHFNYCEFRWTNRACNTPAHLVAQLAYHNELNSNWIFSPPLPIARALTQDARGIPPRCFAAP